MPAMPEPNWTHFFRPDCEAPTSIAVDLALAGEGGGVQLSRPFLLWVRLRMITPRPDGLSSSEEFPILAEIEDALVERLSAACNSVEAGRTTSRGERMFYFYAESEKGSTGAVLTAMSAFQTYKYQFGHRADAEWEAYWSVLYPNEEEWQLAQNGNVLNALTKEGDTLVPERPVLHWIFFDSKHDTMEFATAAKNAGYAIDKEFVTEGKQPYGICVSRTHSVKPDVIDSVVLELFRMAKEYRGNYDGWETQVV